MPITGGLTGENAAFTQTLLLNNDKVHDKVVILSIYGTNAVGHSAAGVLMDRLAKSPVH
jgi:hypothetical protein